MPPLATNQANASQLRDRINRIGQTASRIVYITVHIGLLTVRLQWKKDAANLQATLETFADEIDVKGADAPFALERPRFAPLECASRKRLI